MAIMTKYFNRDSAHQYLINDNDLMSINIMFDKDVIKECMLSLLQYTDNCNCLLINERELKTYNFPINMYCIGKFKIKSCKELTINYLVPNNSLLFLLNYFYQKIEREISLTNNDLNLLYEIESDNKKERNEKQLELIQNLKDSIIFKVKRTYNYSRVEKMTFDSLDLLVKELLPLNGSNIAGVLENAYGNTSIINKLNIEFNKDFQKVKV